MFEIGIIHELHILCDSFLCDGVDNPVAHLFEIKNVLKSVRGFIEGSGDGISWWRVECKIDDMVECLSCNVGELLRGVKT